MRQRVGIIFGGRSGEHDVSISSARSVFGALDPAKYEAVPLAVARNGKWLLPEESHALLTAPMGAPPDAVVPAVKGAVADRRQLTGIDVVFPLIHGPNGEDGTLQGMLELAGIPYVGSGVLGSAVGMDKVTMKRLFREQGFPIADFQLVFRHQWESDPQAVMTDLEGRFPYPFFVKPANMGSSVGISKVRNRAELKPALALAAGFDRRIIVEEGIPAPRELEVGILGNERPEASVVGEVVPCHEFYDYAAKYLEDGSKILIPADVSPEIAQRAQALAVAAFQTLDLAGLARVDFFLADDRLFLNEVNTLPGFTPKSMYPMLWQASGLAYGELLDRLIQLALERHGSTVAVS